MTKKTAILLFFILVKFILQYFLIAPGYDLQRDEYLHLDQARHLAWGFESVPPFTSWISRIILLLGNSVWWVKFFPALFGALTIVVVWKTIALLRGNLYALVLGATAITFSSLLRINILFQPNSFDILCWTAFYYTIARYINDNNNKWLYYSAVVFALGFLNKYNIAFLVAGMVPAILLSPYRRLLLNRHLYLATGLALLIISPNLVWQYQNNFPVVHHMKVLSATQLVNVDRSGFLKEQILFFINAIYIIIAAFIGFFTWSYFKKYRLFFWSYVFTIFIFVYFKAKGYYAIGLYPVFIAFGALYVEHLLRNRPAYYLRPVLLLVTIVLFIPIIKIGFPVYSPAETARHAPLYKKFGLLRWEDGKDHIMPQDFADMLGWKELTRKVFAIYDTISDKEHTLVLCDNYGQAGAINYYSSHKIQAVSLNADYINWFDFSKPYRHVILVQEINDTDPGRERERPLFESIIPGGKIEDSLAREKGTTIWLLRNAKVSINDILKNEINKKKMGIED